MATQRQEEAPGKQRQPPSPSDQPPPPPPPPPTSTLSMAFLSQSTFLPMRQCPMHLPPSTSLVNCRPLPSTLSPRAVATRARPVQSDLPLPVPSSRTSRSGVLFCVRQATSPSTLARLSGRSQVSQRLASDRSGPSGKHTPEIAVLVVCGTGCGSLVVVCLHLADQPLHLLPLHVTWWVQKLSLVEPVVVGRIVLGVVRGCRHRRLVPVDGKVVEEASHQVGEVARRPVCRRARAPFSHQANKSRDHACAVQRPQLTKLSELLVRHAHLFLVNLCRSRSQLCRRRGGRSLREGRPLVLL
mmetsp:Transcript_1553/g.4947  ORF Transcript_1553/g.4947 Transcript_1553/m.4947 type:complete len:299 (-) Transcript_1553:1841-2737(-)